MLQVPKHNHKNSLAFFSVYEHIVEKQTNPIAVAV